jgi:hypothetical protein
MATIVSSISNESRVTSATVIFYISSFTLLQTYYYTNMLYNIRLRAPCQYTIRYLYEQQVPLLVWMEIIVVVLRYITCCTVSARPVKILYTFGRSPPSFVSSLSFSFWALFLLFCCWGGHVTWDRHGRLWTYDAIFVTRVLSFDVNSSVKFKVFQNCSRRSQYWGHARITSTR